MPCCVVLCCACLSTQGFEAPQLLSSLLTLQSLAEDAELLAELQSDSQDAVAAALAIHTNAAAAGMMPALMMAADAMQENMSSASCCSAAKLRTSAVGISSSSSDRSSSAPAQPAALGASQQVSSQQCSCCSCSGKAACCCFKPSIFQLAAQLCCFPGMLDVTLPWLQLLTRFHAFTAGFNVGVDENAAKSLSPHRVAAMAFALESFGIVLSPLLEAVRHAWDGRMTDPPVFSMLPKGCASGLQSLWQRASAPVTHQQPCQTQQDGQQQVPDTNPVDDVNGMHTVAYWLHAERLVEVMPQHWQQHLAEHVLSSDGSSCGGKADGALSSEQRSWLSILADRACDHCSQPLPEQAPHGSDSNSSSCGSTGVFGCPVCGFAQYCSRPCADAAKKVHEANCW